MFQKKHLKKESGLRKCSLSMISEKLHLGSPDYWKSVLIMGLLMLSACSNLPRKVELIAEPVVIKQPELKPRLPNPAPMSLRLFKVKILQKDKEAYFCLSPKGYEALSFNQAENLRWVKEALYRLDYYGKIE